MVKNNFTFKKILRFRQFIGSQYLILAFFWMIFIALLITILILFSKERAVHQDYVNDLIKYKIPQATSDVQKIGYYQDLMNINFGIIDISVMLFFKKEVINTVNEGVANWTERFNTMNTAYSYLFITTLIAIIGLVCYLIIIFKLYVRHHFGKRYQLSNQFPNDFLFYDSKIYLNFITNLAIVFSFFNFLPTLIVLIYGIILLLVSYFFWYILKIKTEILVKHQWWRSSNFILFTSVLLFQNIYNLSKQYFITKFDVNLDLILSIILPIGTITIVITLLIRNMLASQVTAVKKGIKTISDKVKAFQIFYHTQQEKALEDYNFVNQLPILIRDPLQKNTIDTKQAVKLMAILEETIKFFYQNIEQPKKLNYMFYHLFNNITEIAEIEEIKNNIIKIKNITQTKKSLIATIFFS